MSRIVIVQFKDKSYYASITNHSLSMGTKLNLLTGSQLTDVLVENPTYQHCLNIIYLAIIGFNKNLKLTYDEFLHQCHWKKEVLNEVYTQLISGVVDIPENKFAEELINKTSKVTSTNEKKIKPINLKFECAEDRYVIYCLVYGIDHDIFWYSPIADVERIFNGIKAYKGWQSNPMTV